MVGNISRSGSSLGCARHAPATPLARSYTLSEVKARWFVHCCCYLASQIMCSKQEAVARQLLEVLL